MRNLIRIWIVSMRDNRGEDTRKVIGEIQRSIKYMIAYAYKGGHKYTVLVWNR